MLLVKLFAYRALGVFTIILDTRDSGGALADNDKESRLGVSWLDRCGSWPRRSLGEEEWVVSGERRKHDLELAM